MNRQDWLDARRKGIGGSDIPVILGLSPFKTRYQLWLEKTGQTSPDEDNPDIRRGQALEDIIAGIYTEQTGRDLWSFNYYPVDSLPLVHPDFSWILASPDRWFEEEESERTGVVEIKAPRLRKFNQIKRQGLPDYMIAQIQWYLLFPEFDFGSWAIFSAEAWELIHFDVEPDPDLQKLIVEEAEKFWFKHVLAKEPPEEILPEDKPELPPIDPQEGLLIRNDEEWKRAVHLLKEARDIKAEGELLEKEAKERIIALMEGHSVVEGGGARIYYRRREGRKTLDKKRLQAEHPEINLDDYMKQGRAYMEFKPYFLKED
jgi:putative phage-type endonuclease